MELGKNEEIYMKNDLSDKLNKFSLDFIEDNYKKFGFKDEDFSDLRGRKKLRFCFYRFIEGINYNIFKIIVRLKYYEFINIVPNVNIDLKVLFDYMKDNNIKNELTYEESEFKELSEYIYIEFKENYLYEQLDQRVTNKMSKIDFFMFIIYFNDSEQVKYLFDKVLELFKNQDFRDYYELNYGV